MTADEDNGATIHIPEGSVIVTPSQMYDEIRSANSKIDHLTDVLDPALDNIREDLADIKRKQDEHDIRIAEGENWRSRAKGALGVLLFVTPVGTWLITYLTG